jgi:hypothetical protein
MHHPAGRSGDEPAAVGAGKPGEPEERPCAVRESREQDQRRAEQRPRRQPQHRAEQVRISTPCKGIERDVRRTNDEEGRAEEYAVVAEHMRYHESRDEHRDQRDQQRGSDDADLGIDGVRQGGVRRPRPPERGEDEHAVPDPRERRIVRKQLSHLREREDENEVEEELARRDAVLLGGGRHAPPSIRGRRTELPAVDPFVCHCFSVFCAAVASFAAGLVAVEVNSGAGQDVNQGIRPTRRIRPRATLGGRNPVRDRDRRRRRSRSVRPHERRSSPRRPARRPGREIHPVRSLREATV